MNEQVIRNIALLEELETSAKLIKLGFGELQNLDTGNDFYFLPFQLLSQGFERLMKAYICLGYLNKHNKYPIYDYIRKKSHDLEKLLNTILEEYYNNHNLPLLKEDEEFLKNNPQLKRLLYILSEFGKFARYHNFDIITGKSQPGMDPKEEWEAFENELLTIIPNGFERMVDLNTQHEVFGKISRSIIILFERYIAALSRQFNFRTLGSLGHQYSVVLYNFSLLEKSKYGQTNYRQHTTSYNQMLKPGHKRTEQDELERKYNPQYKYKEIKKTEYNGDWPFYADEVIVECREKHWCIITINGYDYALNGNAKGRYKLENVHEAGMAILGKSISHFIEIALKL